LSFKLTGSPALKKPERIMKNISVFLLLFVTVFAACRNEKKEELTALAFSERIVTLETSLGQPLSDGENLMRSYSESNNFPGMTQLAKSLEETVQSKITQIENISVSKMKGGKAFKKSALDYFGFIKSIYTTYGKIGAASSEGARLAAVRELGLLLNARQMVVDRMQQAQQQFALENNFNVEQQP
jgi:hypothetical protein